MRLQQGQVWKQNDGDQYFRIVELERLAVKFKAMTSLSSRDGSHHEYTKKEFCRLIKGCTLLMPEQTRARE